MTFYFVLQLSTFFDTMAMIPMGSTQFILVMFSRWNSSFFLIEITKLSYQICTRIFAKVVLSCV